MYKKIIFTLILFCSAFFISNKVSAKELTNFCDYIEPCLTTEFVNDVMESGEFDKSVYDSYLVIANRSNVGWYGVYILIFKSSSLNETYISTDQNGSTNIYFGDGGHYMYFTNGNHKLKLEDIHGVDYTSSVLGFTLYNSNTVSYTYYTNADILDQDGNIVLEKNEVDDEFTIFHDSIYGTKYSKVELEFDISENYEQDLYLNYDMQLIFPDGKKDEFNTFDGFYFEEIATFCNNNICSLPKNNYIEVFNTMENSFLGNYSFKINSNPKEKYTSSLKLVIDLTFDSTIIIGSHIESNIPFTVKYYDRVSDSTEENYYATIDMTNNYGVMFIPKLDLSEYDVNIRTLFSGIGHLDIQHRSTHDPNNYKIISSYSMNHCSDYLLSQNEIPYSCNSMSGSFEFFITNDNLYQSLFFVNSVYDNDLTSKVSVTYDTRYYIYYIFENKDSVVSIFNPNTGENYDVSLNDFYNFVSTKDNFKVTFNTFLKPMNFIISSFTEFYENYCPAVVQKFFYISFMLFVTLFIIRLIW